MKNHSIQFFLSAIWSPSIGFGLVALSLLLPYPALSASPLEMGIKAYHAGKYQEAIGRLGQAESTDFNNASLHYYMANALAKTNQTKDAIKEYKIALAMEPEGQLAGYCKQALKALGAGASDYGAKSKPKRASLIPDLPDVASAQTPSSAAPPIANKPHQTPRVITNLCGCSRCQRLQLIMTDLQSKYGNKIVFVRNSKTPASNFGPRSGGCSEVFFYDSTGALTSQYQGNIPEMSLYRDTKALIENEPAAAAPTLDSDHRNSSLGESIAREAEARISQDQKRVESNIKQILDELKNANYESLIGTRRGFDYAAQVRDQQEAERKIQALRAELDRRTKETRANAKNRIDSMSTQGKILYPTGSAPVSEPKAPPL